jgi:hypothetical protein
MRIFKSKLIVAAMLTTLAACGGQDDPGVDLSDHDGSLGLLDKKGLLGFLNDQTLVTADFLDYDCAIRADSASNIILHRDGPDGIPGTEDDNLFDGLEELDGIKMVGSWTLEQLYICAAKNSYLFSDEAGMLAFLNDQAKTTLEKLDVECAIRSDSAAFLIQHRDGIDVVAGTQDDNLFDNLQEVDDVDMVGLWTMERLYSCAGTFGYLSVSNPEPDESATVYDLYSLDPNLREVILEDISGRAEQLSDQSVSFPVRFAEVTIFSAKGVPVLYEVRFVQTIDPEGGIQVWYVFTLDQDYVVTDSDVYI